jgi:hypothetical protein
MVAVPVTPAFIPPPTPVPGVRGAPLGLAYQVLRENGLAATIHGPFRAGTDVCLPLVSSQSPGVDRSVAAGAVISLTIVTTKTCLQSRPGVPTGPRPKATVPDFTGAPLTRAVHWADTRDLNWATGPLATVRDADRGQLLANWRITSQSPLPGMTLRPRTGRRRASAGSLRPTRLVLEAEPIGR